MLDVVSVNKIKALRSDALRRAESVIGKVYLLSLADGGVNAPPIG